MPEDVTNHFVFTKFTTPVSETLRKILDNDTTTRDKIPLKILRATKVESGSVAVMLEK